MLADPQSVTINAVAHSLAKTGQGASSGTFNNSEGTVIETVSHTYGRRIRRAVKLQFSKIAEDPLISAQNIKHSMSCTVVFDVPVTGFTAAEAKQVWDGLAAQLAASSGLVVTKILGGEN